MIQSTTNFVRLISTKKPQFSRKEKKHKNAEQPLALHGFTNIDQCFDPFHFQRRRSRGPGDQGAWGPGGQGTMGPGGQLNNFKHCEFLEY